MEVLQLTKRQIAQRQVKRSFAEQADRLVVLAADISLDGAVITAEGQSTISVQVANNDNRLLILSFAVYQGNSPSGITFNGVAMTKIKEQVGSFNEQCSIWGLIAPAVGTYNLVMTGASNYYAVGIYRLYNCEQSLPTNFNGASGDNNNASLSITTTAANAWIISVLESEPDPTMTTSGGVADWEQEGQSFQHGAGQHYIQAAAGAKTMSWSLAYGARWNQVNVQVNPLPLNIKTSNIRIKQT